jgi:hypothetical protein
MIEIRISLSELRKCFTQACRDDAKEFEVNGLKFNTDFAKYFITHLEKLYERQHLTEEYCVTLTQEN